MGRTAIVVDGSESEIREDLVVPIDGIGTGRRVPWGAIAIGLLTAVVAMGALGEDPASSDASSAASSAASSEVLRAACPVPPGPDPADARAPTPGPTVFPWWELPAPVVVWVDPATGLLRTRERAVPERPHLVPRGR